MKVASVDSFEGKEKDYIILSCVRSNEHQHQVLIYLLVHPMEPTSLVSSGCISKAKCTTSTFSWWPCFLAICYSYSWSYTWTSWSSASCPLLAVEVLWLDEVMLVLL